MDFLLAAANPLDHVVPQVVFHIGSVPVTNHMIMSTVAAVLMVLIFPPLFHKPVSDAPSGTRNFFEAFLQYLREDTFRPALRQHTDRFTPFLWTVFFFILFCNLLGSIPINELLIVFSGGAVYNMHEFHLAHIGGTATGNIATTAALAVCAFVFIHLNGIWQIIRELMAGTYGHHGEEVHDAHGRQTALALDQGIQSNATEPGVDVAAVPVHVGPHGTNFFAATLLAPAYYIWNFAPHVLKPQPGASKVGWLADIPVWTMLLVLEFIGALIKPFALAMRLFANMISGHVVLAALIGLIPVTLGVLAQIGVGVPVTALSLMIRMLELFVAFLQAYIFTFLTTLFVAAAVAPEH